MNPSCSTVTHNVPNVSRSTDIQHSNDLIALVTSYTQAFMNHYHIGVVICRRTRSHSSSQYSIWPPPGLANIAKNEIVTISLIESGSILCALA